MSTPLQKAEAPKRYPKRKRTAVSYKDIIESEELGEDVDHNVYLHESDQDEDWHVAKRVSLVQTAPTSLQDVTNTIGTHR